MQLDRRTLLRGAALTGAVGAAGCLAPSESDSDPGSDPGTSTDPHAGTDTGTEPGTDTSATETSTWTNSYDGDGPAVSLEPVARGVVSPTQMVAAPTTDRLYLVDQVGVIYEVGPDGLDPEPFLDFSNRVVVSPERGLLGLAFHPEFPDDPRLFLRYSVPRREGTPADYSHTELLTEMKTTADGTEPRVGTERTLIEFPSPTIYHQAGTIVFGPDGYLYVAMGEGTKRKFAQDVETNLLGAIHRIDVDSTTGDRPYGIPEDNPLVGTGGRDEYFAWGFRNPWRMSFNDGDLVVGDVGSFRWEELDVVEKGTNYGWPYREGAHCTGWNDSADSGEHCGVDLSTVPGEDFRDPVLEFPHSGDGELTGTAIIAGYVYGRDDIAALRDGYLFSNYTASLDTASGDLFVADPSAEGQWPARKLDIANSPNREVNRVVNSLARDNDGHLYALTVGVPDKQNRFEYEAGAVHRIVPPGSASGPLPKP